MTDRRHDDRRATDHVARNVLEIAPSVLSDMDLEAVLERVLEAARELTGARYAALGVLDEQGSRLERFITIGVDDATREKLGAPPTGRGVLGELFHAPGALRLADVGAHPRSYGFPVEHPPMTSFLGAPIFVAGEQYGNVYLTNKQGAAQFEVEDEEALVLLAQFAGLAIDHARRFTGSETRREELQRTVQALDASMQIARALGGESDLDTMLALVAKRGRALVSARALVIEHRRGDELVVAAGAGDLPPDLIGQRIDLQGSVASTALRTVVGQRLEDKPNRLRFERYGLGRLGFHASAGLVVPLVCRGQPDGVLVVVDRLVDGPAFSAEDERLLAAFASSAATGIATARLIATDRRSESHVTAEHERGRWARELHDETLQNLAAVRLSLVAALRSAEPQATTEAVRAAVARLDADIASLRALITDLRPAELDQLGAHAAIEALVERARHCGLRVDLCVDLAYEHQRADSRLIPELETAIYRITQEALTNARKHGNANRAVIEVTEDDTTVRLGITDDGSGFDPTITTSGFGLLGMHERAELLEGTLTIDSAPSDGTTVTATFPVRRRGLGRPDAAPAADIGQEARRPGQYPGASAG